MFVAIFISINIIAQNNNQRITFSSNENTYELMNYSEENIIVISIFNIKDPVEIKVLDKLAENYYNDNVTFIAITDKLSDSIVNLVKSKTSHYHHLAKEENNRVFNIYQTGTYKVFPMQIILNKEGKVVYKKKGKTNHIDEKLAKRINKLLDIDSNAINNQELQYTSR